MHRHRLAPEADYYRLPIPPVPQFRPASFVLCPISLVPGCTFADWAQTLCVIALEQAIETARPALPDRGLFAFWN